MEHQLHFGKKFYLDRKKGYWISTTCPRIRAHVWVWSKHFGEVPKGFHIHHKDGDKSNNFIDNLELMNQFDHLSLHSSKPENRKRSSEHCDRIRLLTKEWHRSQEGREWHRLHAIRCNFGKNENKEMICENCGINYFTTKLSNTRFCSNKCKSSSRRASGIDDVKRTCIICLKEFFNNKYSKGETCGRKCGQVFRSRKDRSV